MTNIIQAEYDQLDKITTQFGHQAEVNAEMQGKLAQSFHTLTKDGWTGKGEAQFSHEMTNQVFPAVQHLIQALEEAKAVTLQTKAMMQLAEEEAAKSFEATAQNGVGTALNGQMMPVSFSPHNLDGGFGTTEPVSASSPPDGVEDWDNATDEAWHDTDPAVRYQETVEALKATGLPVDVLKTPLDRIVIDETSGINNYDLTFNALNLSPDVLDIGQMIKDDGPLGISDNSNKIGTLFHEATHAYLDIFQNHPGIQPHLQAGVEYYTDAPLKNGDLVDDPERVFQEAAASYVGNKATAYAGAYGALQNLMRPEIPADTIPEHIEIIKDGFNTKMADQTHGYEPTGIPFINEGQVSTTRKISPELADFLDQQILKMRIPNDFDSVEQFQPLIDAAMERHHAG